MRTRMKAEVNLIPESEKWQRVIELVEEMSAEPKGMYQPIEHPFFKDWGVTQICSDRLQTIIDYVEEINGKKILDIGCCFGYFSHKLAKMGAEVVGIDICEPKIEVCKLLSDCYNLPPSNPKFYCLSYQEYLKSGEFFDIILFLSQFHHDIRADEKAAWSGLNFISRHTDLLLIDTDVIFRPELMVERTEFTKLIPLKPSQLPRMMYVLQKES